MQIKLEIHFDLTKDRIILRNQYSITGEEFDPWSDADRKRLVRALRAVAELELERADPVLHHDLRELARRSTVRPRHFNERGRERLSYDELKEFIE